jgi:hypothetical protein
MRSGYAPLQALKATDDALQTGRESILEGFQRGTVGINEMVLDQAAHADNALNAAAHIRQKYLMDPEAWVDAQIAAQKMDPANRLREIANTQAYQRVQSAKLAKWIRELPDEFRQSATGGIPERLNFFGNHPLADLMTYIDKFGRMRASGNAAQNLIARNLLDLNAGPLPKGAVTVKDALNRAGLVSEPMGAGGIQPGAHENLLGIINRERLKNLGPVAPLQNLDDLYIPGEIGSELGRYVGSFQAPEAAGKIGSAIDYLTNLFKSHVTRGWPAFHVRNLMSGQGVNIAEGAPGAVGRVGEGFGMVGGKAIPDAHLLPMFAGRNLTPEQATAELGQMVAAYNILGHKANVTRDVIGPAGQALMMPHSLDDVLGAIPGYQPKNLGTVWERLKGGAGTSWNPKNVVNVAGAGTSKDIFPLAAAGAEMGDIIEAANRIPQFTSLLRQGWAPEAAAKKVLASHFDYSASAFTPFERTVMKRLVPFYSYQKNVIPQTLRQLYEQPGGFAGTLARLSYGTRQQGGFLPSYLGDSLAIPLGDQNAEGFRRYLTKIDFAPESAFSFFPGTMGDPVQNSLMSLLGQTNPLFKGPLEYAANRQFHTGRELGDLHAVTGNPLLEHTLANSPVARYMSLFRTATNPQKWDPYAIPLNLLTGVRVSDVDMPKYRDIAEREYVKKALQGLPAISKFENLSVKPELAHTLTPEEIELLQLQRLLEQRAREKKKIRVEGGR